LEVGRGDVFCLDDSYLHSVHNGGSESRVVLDVTFWHPDLLSRGDSAGRDDGEAALSAVLLAIDASLEAESAARFSRGVGWGSRVAWGSTDPSGPRDEL
jgi:hypothetical protein